MRACTATELRCVGEATLSVKCKRGAANRSVKLGRVLVVADGGRKDQITLSLTPAQRSALNGLTKAKRTIAYDVVDTGGNVGKGKTIKLKTCHKQSALTVCGRVAILTGWLARRR